MVAHLDNHQYSQDELIEIAIPFYIPYQTESSGYERVDGEITIKGIHYNYVKRKYSNGSLFLVCIVNKGKSELQSSKIRMSAESSSTPAQGSKQSMPIKKAAESAKYQYTAALFQRELVAIQSVQPLVLLKTRLCPSILEMDSPPPEV